jgi:DNA polymerase
VVVALGATAARSVLGRPIPVGKSRGKLFKLEDGTPVAVTQHPSALLRIPDEPARRTEFRRFAGDLRRIGKLLKD